MEPTWRFIVSFVWIPGIYGGYLFAADILVSFVLVWFAYVIYRRTMLRPRYLTLGKRINVDRAEEDMHSGAATVAAAGPFCAAIRSNGLRDKESTVVVKDIAELVDEATL